MSLVTSNDKGETVVHKAAFRCKNCGHLTPAHHAGENLLPHSCPACKRGVTFQFDPSTKDRLNTITAKLAQVDTTQEEREQLLHEMGEMPREKLYHPDNWEVLADATPDRLIELGLHADSVTAHKPAKITKPSQGRIVKVEAADEPKVKDGSHAGVS